MSLGTTVVSYSTKTTSGAETSTITKSITINAGDRVDICCFADGVGSTTWNSADIDGTAMTATTSRDTGTGVMRHFYQGGFPGSGTFTVTANYTVNTNRGMFLVVYVTPGAADGAPTDAPVFASAYTKALTTTSGHRVLSCNGSWPPGGTTTMSAGTLDQSITEDNGHGVDGGAGHSDAGSSSETHTYSNDKPGIAGGIIIWGLAAAAATAKPAPFALFQQGVL